MLRFSRTLIKLGFQPRPFYHFSSEPPKGFKHFDRESKKAKKEVKEENDPKQKVD